MCLPFFFLVHSQGEIKKKKKKKKGMSTKHVY